MNVWPSVFCEPSVGIGTHHALVPGVVPPAPAAGPPVLMPSVEMFATHMWTMGVLLGANKISYTVRALGVLPIVLEGHDVGILIPDLSVAPAVSNVLYPLTWPFSSRKAMFSCSTVRANATPAAAMGGPFLVLSCSFPVSIPVVVVNAPKPINMGVTWQDVLRGALLVLVTIGLDAVFSYLPSRGPQPAPPGSFRDALRRLPDEIAGKVSPREALKALLAASAGFQIDVLCGRDPTFEYKLGVFGVERGIKVDSSGVSQVLPFGYSYGSEGLSSAPAADYLEAVDVL